MIRKFKDFDTGELWMEEEVRQAYEEMPELLEEYPTFEEYLEHALKLGEDRVGGIIEIEE